jgi:hypothetical protein
MWEFIHALKRGERCELLLVLTGGVHNITWLQMTINPIVEHLELISFE